MPKRKQSFFSRLRDSMNVTYDEGDDAYYDDQPQDLPIEHVPDDQWDGQHDLEQAFLDEAQLAVDMYETPENIIVQAMVAGLSPSSLEVSIAREQVTIRGERRSESYATDEDYYHQELYWGKFSRMIQLPAEIETDMAEAIEDHGLLTITLPKIDKGREKTLEVRSSSN